MKTPILLLCITLIGLGCNNNNKTESKTNDGHAEQHGSTIMADKSDSLSLNIGEKWKADSSTNLHVANLTNITRNFAEMKVKNKEAYLSLSSDLQSEIESLVKGCRMKGEDHDALHKWLEPLMAMVKKLAGISTAEEGAKDFENIDAQVKLYHKYFN